jgi:probable phosphoglycerate mutase
MSRDRPVETTVYLVRHGAYSLLGQVLVGRALDVSLDRAGHLQAQALARYFLHVGVSSVQSSPRARTLQTARPIAERLGLELVISSAIDEVDCGEWGGRSFGELDNDPAWQRWNTLRSSTRPPGGESMSEVQQRIIAHLRRVRSQHPSERVLMVTHADVIRAAVLYSLGLPLDSYNRIEISPAAVSTVLIGRVDNTLISLNAPVAA